jgi:hypothetical protein
MNKAKERYINYIIDPTISSKYKFFPSPKDQYKPKEIAIAMPYIKINDSGICYVVVDIDREDSFEYWNNINFLRPTIISQNKENGHCHYLYEINNKNISFYKLDFVHEALKNHLDSHKIFSYQKQLSKNPISNYWYSEYYDKIYDIKELIGNYRRIKENICTNRNLEKFIIGTEKIYEGERNNSLFNLGLNYAYNSLKEYNLEKDVYNFTLNYITEINSKNVIVPLEMSEINNIAWSISKRVIHKRNKFSNRQRKRAILSNKAQKESTINKILIAKQRCIENKLIITTTKIAELSDLSIRTIQRNLELLF